MADDELPSGDADAPEGIDPTMTAYGLIEPIEIEEEMERSFLDYSMSVIVSRALPDVRDGLKPVHRRILWGMYDLGARPDRQFMKCARVTGEVMGKYHPHGDSAIYDALVRMAQDHSLRHPLVAGHGNFGSPDYGAAAARYTECRLDPLSLAMLADIDEDTVNFVDNYSGEFQEPQVLPSRFPNLLVNGSQGIAVGMATNIAPHNLGEIIDATVHLMDNPEATPDDLMQFVHGPDFPTGALIMGRAGIHDAYRTGRGSIRMRAVAEIEESSRGGDKIVISQLPYQVGPNSVLSKIKELVATKEIEGISDANEESAGDDTRIVIPGLVNAHMHTWQTALRGVAANWTLLEYFQKMHAGLATVFTPDDLHIAILVGALNQLNCGTTTLVDWCHNNPTPAHNDAAIAGLLESGIRGAPPSRFRAPSSRRTGECSETCARCRPWPPDARLRACREHRRVRRCRSPACTSR